MRWAIPPVTCMSDPESGFLVDEGDIQGMAQAMITLSRSPDRAAAMGRKARTHIHTNFSTEASIKRLADILEQAASTKAGECPSD